jgi:hypothetical protein
VRRKAIGASILSQPVAIQLRVSTDRATWVVIFVFFINNKNKLKGCRSSREGHEINKSAERDSAKENL